MSPLLFNLLKRAGLEIDVTKLNPKFRLYAMGKHTSSKRSATMQRDINRRKDRLAKIGRKHARLNHK